jgi:hypothetical protein
LSLDQINAFTRCIERVNVKLHEDVLPEISKAYIRLATGTSADVLLSPQKQINEAQIRQYVLDPLLASLGWDLTSAGGMLVEAPAEPIRKEDNRRFLDYLGQDSSAESEALLVVEAKRLSLALPALKGKEPNEDSFVEALVAAVKNKKHVITEEWKDILCTLMDYAQRLNKSGVGVPLKMALMNGEWIVIFLDPRKTLVQKIIDAGDLLVAANTESAMAQSRELYANLAFRELSNSLPPQHYVDFRRLVSDQGETLDASLAVEVAMGDIGMRPLMTISESVTIQLPNGAWVRFYDEVHEPRVLRDDAELADDMKEITRRTTSLFKELEKRRPLRLIDSAAYETRQTRDPISPSTQLLVREQKGRYVWYLGKHGAPFVDPGDHEDCPYHSHGAAQAKGLGQPANAILRRSIEPPAYFPSGSKYHCAHKAAHVLRHQRNCPIFYIEEHLCCRACSLQDRCWPNGFADFPCVQAGETEVDLLADFGPSSQCKD